jgi:DNA-binding NarL/FixJ family response regulator
MVEAISAMATGSVLLVEDHDMARRSIRTLLSSDPTLSIISETTNGEEAVKMAVNTRPGVILMDISLPGISGIQAAKRIREAWPGARIIFLSQHDSIPIVRDALSMGAEGYVVKSDAGHDLLAAIRAAREGRRFVSRTLHGVKLDSVSRM